MSASVKPQAREAGLVIEELDDELLVYDLEHHKAHCLNRTAALVWKHCDGKTAADGIASRLRQETKTPIDDEVVWVALRRLGKANLLCERVAPPQESAFQSSRRDLLKKIALVGGLSVATIVAPTAAEAALSLFCQTAVSCKHLCISDHNITTLPCPGGVTDQQANHCCSHTKGNLCVTPNSSGSCTGPACC
jgi:hypothetical protein